VDVYYTQQGKAEGDIQDHINQFWHHARAGFTDGVWSADLPLATANEALWVYANVLYKLPRPVTGAGYYYGIYSTEYANLSSLLQIATPEQLSASGVKATLKPGKLIETFAEGWQKEWFTTKPEEWARQTHKVYHPLWSAPQEAELGLDVISLQANKMVISIDQYAAEIALTGGPDIQTISLSPADFHDVDGNVLNSWQGIKELSLAPSKTLRSKKEGTKPRQLGSGQWQGAPPRFRSLRWIDSAP